MLSALATPEGRAAGVPGGGAVMTAADLARFYSALLADPEGVWKPEVLADATGNIRCTLPDPLLGAPVNRTIGLVVAGDDGQHTMRYACFGAGVSPRAFGHAGAHGQVAWADPGHRPRLRLPPERGRPGHDPRGRPGRDRGQQGGRAGRLTPQYRPVRASHRRPCRP